jgi:hypothetical protein
MSKRQRRRVRKQRRHEGSRERHLGRTLTTGAGVTIGATLLMGGAAQAACTCTVDSLLDPTDAGHTTLRDAITSANANAGSTITFASGLSGNTIMLNGTQLPQITAYSTTIQGPSGGITIDANYNSRIFNVSASDVTISGLTVTHGVVAANGGGGILLQAGQLTLTDAVVIGNASESGTDGGGIEVATGNLTVDRSTIANNESSNFGGGIDTHAAPVLGGGATIIRNSTISGNEAIKHGGGAYFNYQAPATVSNSTIYDNETGASYPGGGLYHAGDPQGDPGLVVTGSTITHNQAGRGGGVGSNGSSGWTQPILRDTIVSDNTAPDGADVSANDGSMDAGFSLIGVVDPDSTINATGPNMMGTNPQLGVLGDNGGQTQTQKPAATSPVIDAGSAFGLTGDQRGLARPFDAITANAAGGDASDIGAVELQVSDIAAAPVPTTPTTPGTTTPATKKKCKKKKKHKRSAESAKKKGCKKKKKKGGK